VIRLDPAAAVRSFRLALRGLRNRPGFAGAVLITLTLGIGANTAMFSVVNSIMLRPLPYAEPDRLVVIWPENYLGLREVDYLRTEARELDAIGAFSPGWLMGLTGVAEPTQVSAARITGNLFGLLGVAPAIGRAFGMEGETPGQDRLAVLSDGLWRRSFGGDPAIVGRSIQLDFEPYTVLGVMPPDFQILNTDTDLWTPLTMDRDAVQWSGQMAQLVGRLGPGSTLASADAEFRSQAVAMGRTFSRPDDWARSARVGGWQDELVGGVRTALLVLLGSVGFLLLIASANVANLLLVRTAERRHEFALRFSLGASRRQIASQLLGESLVLAVFGGLGGVVLAAVMLRLVPFVLPDDVPRLAEIGMDGTVLAVAAGVTVLTALAFGSAPALHAARDASGTWLRSGHGIGGRDRGTRGALIAIEVALALVLLAGAGLMIRTVRALHAVDPGFRPGRLLTLQLQPSGFSRKRQLSQCPDGPWG
jgi:putative ABC transport system permease protein